MRVGVLGAGTWGTALARMLCMSGHEVSLWSALAAEIEELRKTRQHKNLPNMDIPDRITLTTELQVACCSDILLFAVPSFFVRSTT